MQPSLPIIAQCLGCLGVERGIHSSAGVSELLGADGRGQCTKGEEALTVSVVGQCLEIGFKVFAPLADAPLALGIEPIMFAVDGGAGDTLRLERVDMIHDDGKLCIAVEAALAILPVEEAIEISFITPNDIFAVLDLRSTFGCPSSVGLVNGRRQKLSSISHLAETVKECDLCLLYTSDAADD